MIFRSRAPMRVSFGGGGTDVSPYCEEFGGCVVNATINHFIWASLEFRKDKKIYIESFDLTKNILYPSIQELFDDEDLDIVKVTIRHFKPNFGFNFYLRSDVPPQAGLGGSATAFVAVIGVFNHLLGERRLDRYEIAELAYRLEREELKNPGGRQDQYASTFGGFNFIEFKGNDFVRVNPLNVDRDTILELEKHLVLANIGPRQKSGNVIEDQVKRYMKKTDQSKQALHSTKALAIKIKHHLLRGDLEGFGRLLDQAWIEKKKFSPLVTNPFIDELYQSARHSGSFGGKITGAGGGGHMMFFCKPNQEQSVTKVLMDKGVHLVDFSFVPNGLETWETKQITNGELNHFINPQ